jgi:hypothetical protein
MRRARVVPIKVSVRETKSLDGSSPSASQSAILAFNVEKDKMVRISAH